MSKKKISKKELKQILKYCENSANGELGELSKWINSALGGKKSKNLSNFAGLNQLGKSKFFKKNSFLNGAILGAAVVYFCTNENAQTNLFKFIAKGSELFEMGIEEMKERFLDAKAQMSENEI